MSPNKPRRTQAERRERTRAAVLEQARRLFGEQGYADTSLDAVASAAGVTIRPIYHYFGNKRALFEATVQAYEARLLVVLEDPSFTSDREGLLSRFRACLRVLADPSFQRVVLVDAPAVLGRDRWVDAPVTRAATQLIDGFPLGDDPVRAELVRRMLIGALAEAALALAESETSDELEQRVGALADLARGFLAFAG